MSRAWFRAWAGGVTEFIYLGGVLAGASAALAWITPGGGWPAWQVFAVVFVPLVAIGLLAAPFYADSKTKDEQ